MNVFHWIVEFFLNSIYSSGVEMLWLGKLIFLCSEAKPRELFSLMFFCLAGYPSGLTLEEEESPRSLLFCT